MRQARPPTDSPCNATRTVPTLAARPGKPVSGYLGPFSPRYRQPVEQSRRARSSSAGTQGKSRLLGA
jgi:hypothetical protein